MNTIRDSSGMVWAVLGGTAVLPLPLTEKKAQGPVGWDRFSDKRGWWARLFD